jgi:hypothetical protein
MAKAFNVRILNEICRNGLKRLPAGPKTSVIAAIQNIEGVLAVRYVPLET